MAGQTYWELHSLDENRLLMKKIIASAGLLAVGSSVGLQAQYAPPALTRDEMTKPWSVSASLRGFYDDNYLAAHKRFKDESFGAEFSPAAALHFNATDQTRVRLDYIYSLKYYEGRPDEHFDHSHEFRGRADHRFSERTSISLEDAFVYSQEPIIIDEGVPTAVGRLESDADAMRNRAAINGEFALTELWSIGAGYHNLWVDWSEDGDFSRSALLDRMEHLFRFDARYQIQPDLVALAGYQFGIVDYTGDERIAEVVPFGPGPEDAFSEDRNNISHYFYVGGEKSFTELFRANGRVGVRYTDYHEVGESSINPYIDANATYEYLRGSYVNAGVRYDRNATDVGFALEQNTATLYGSLAHRITPQLTGTILGQFFRSEFEEGPSNADIEYALLLGGNLEYQIAQNWFTEFGYNFDRLDSDLPLRSYTRNRVYVGVRARY
jgi:hypothetical protein